jgi:hypothetical protein
MIDVIATRRTTLNGKPYEKDEAGKMPLQQFQDLEPTGRFKRAPAEKKAAAKAAKTDPKSSASAD